ncbi:MAG: NAD(P)/FAD-dependent oxidoreductase [Aquabacterium sp.]|uniref:NAD(P)/FAD-dependent oxidoreductase n=1 Tax=Aquabacterium sp. TaxID=1872578 RepID=UPI0025B86C63|nr:NAD(P)/FAD-dependent oxidoreductase [Aquabacterium sp.]MBI3380486.1 NAD(P)/FAD-dependent oxidoreductase [Aquabacterium sp.]
MRKHHAVIVIGGGPAGSSAARTLASQGVDVALIDKAVFPRAKLCGGLLTLRSRKLFARIFGEAAWDQAFEYEADGIRLFHRDRCLSEVGGHSALYFTCRRDFDHYLLGLAREQGTTLYLGDGLAAIDLDQQVCRLQSGQEIRYDHLIGADGVNSTVARTLFGASYDREKIAFALEMDVDRALLQREVRQPEIYFGVVKWGYGWVFPKRDTVTVGVGGIQARNPQMKQDFEAFLRSVFGTMPPGKIKGHHIPFGDYKPTPGADKVLLAGDAAGLVEPITGEGIAFAMQSGYYAAQAVLEAQASGGRVPALTAYQHRHKAITQALDHANRLRYLIFPQVCERLLVKALPRSTQVTRLHLDLMADEIGYGDYARRLVVRVLKGLVNGRFF